MDIKFDEEGFIQGWKNKFLIDQLQQGMLPCQTNGMPPIINNESSVPYTELYNNAFGTTEQSHASVLAFDGQNNTNAYGLGTSSPTPLAKGEYTYRTISGLN